MENPGLLHIGERILKHLHFKTQAKCRLVKRSWNQILENEASKTRIDLHNLVKSMEEFPIPPDLKNISFILEQIEISEKNDRLCSWMDFVMEMSSKVNNHVINILLKRHISYQLEVEFSSFPLEHFVLGKDMEMVELTLKHKLFGKKYNSTYSRYRYFAESDFDKALEIAVEKRYTDIVQCFKPYMTINHHRKHTISTP